MPRLLVFHLLGVCLLLHQLPTALCSNSTEIVKLCSYELVHYWNKLCAWNKWGPVSSRSKPALVAVLPTDMASYTNKDTETLNKMSKFIPNFQEEGAANEELQKITQKKDSEAEDHRPSELNHLGSNEHSRRRKTLSESLSEKCCVQGCTVKELVSVC
ncbi:prorelaxin H2-like [Orycteropus afer afer]|uniref:Prorelaxin H2-like n=1 Tax=Orycteropus afer afer TaxID=1230840 RepID=A0A8B7AAR6_ORYAF|nr:prorelaxin H2-like [Orycteropus afer afer]